MDIIQVVKGDTGVDLKTVVNRVDTGAPFVADGDIVNLHIRKKGTTELVSTILADWNKSSRTTGMLVFPLEEFLTDTTVEEGFYEGEVEFILADNKIISAFELVNFKVRNDFT